MQRRLAAVKIAAHLRGKHGRAVARMRRDARADGEAANFYREEGERLRIETLHGTAPAGARHPLATARNRESEAQGSLRVDSPGSSSGTARRKAACRRLAAAVLLQSMARRRLTMRRVAPQRRAAKEAKAKRALERASRRLAGKQATAATALQAAVRRRGAATRVAERRGVKARQDAAMASVRRSAAAYLWSVDTKAEAKANRARAGAAALIQAAVRGRRARAFAVGLASLPPDPRVLVHSVAIDDPSLAGFTQVRWPL